MQKRSPCKIKASLFHFIAYLLEKNAKIKAYLARSSAYYRVIYKANHRSYNQTKTAYDRTKFVRLIILIRKLLHLFILP